MKELIRIRSMAAIPSTYAKEKHTVRAVIATENGVDVYDYQYGMIREYLMMDGMEAPSNNQVPLLDSHSRWSIESLFGSARNFATVINAAGEKVKECDVEFSQTEEGVSAETKVSEGHLTDFSVGYRSLDSTFVPAKTSMEHNGRTFEGPCLITKRWKIKELSLTPIGADEVTKTRSAALSPEVRQELITRGMDPQSTNEQAIEFLNSLSTNPQSNGGTMLFQHRTMHLNPVADPPAGGGSSPAPVISVADVQRAERERVAGIMSVSEKFSGRVAVMNDLKTKALSEGWNIERFSAEVLSNLSSRSADIAPNAGSADSLSIDLKDLKDFSITRALNNVMQGRAISGKELEVTKHIAKVTGRTEAIGDRTFIIPGEVLMMRALSAGSFSAGGALVSTEVKVDEVIELLRNKTYVEQLGVRQIDGLVGNIALPKISGGATVYWLAEGVDTTPSDQSFGQVALTPKKMMAVTAFDKQLLTQTSFGVESFIREDIDRVMRIEKDRVALAGTGGAQPLGILNLTGLSTSVTFSAAATWAKILEFETNVATSNADLGSLGYLTTPGSRGKWKGIQKAANLDFIWEKGDIVNGYAARATNQVPLNKVIFGNWSDAIFGLWAGIEITGDPYTLASKDQMRVVIRQLMDFAVRHPQSFSVSTDAGNQ